MPISEEKTWNFVTAIPYKMFVVKCNNSCGRSKQSLLLLYEIHQHRQVVGISVEPYSA